MTPENAARQFLAALPEGCMNCDMSWGPMRFTFVWFYRNMRLKATITSDAIAWGVGTIGTHIGLLGREEWTGEIPPPLLARIEEFSTKGKMT